VLAEDGVSPLAQVGQLSVVGTAVEADPGRCGGPARGGGVEGAGDGLGQLLEPGGQVETAAESGLVEPVVNP
jgi:hypothetical protein